jgi:hypothetical protein
MSHLLAAINMRLNPSRDPVRQIATVDRQDPRHRHLVPKMSWLAA